MIGWQLVYKKMVDSIASLVHETTMLTHSAIQGELSKRGDVSSFNGAYKEIISGINNTLEAMIKPVQIGVKALEHLSRGDFRVRISDDFKGDHKQIKESINAVAESLTQTIREVQGAVHATASASAEISSSAEEMAAGAEEQSSQTADVAGAVEEMSKTIFENTKSTTKALQSAKAARDKAIEGENVVLETVRGMNQIADVVNHSAEQVFRLGQNSIKIGEIVQVINDIADQTNLLALNAAIEAARAGEQGRGFAVVADEVRKLAERTTRATKEIAEMISQINKDTGLAVESMKLGTKEVENGKKLSSMAGDSLKEILVSTDEVMSIVEQVAAASEQQSTATNEISRNIEAINNVTSETSNGVQQIAEAAEDLNRLTTNLQQLINNFVVESDTSTSTNIGRLTGKNRR